jgi:hypothetical protein
MKEDKDMTCLRILGPQVSEKWLGWGSGTGYDAPDWTLTGSNCPDRGAAARSYGAAARPRSRCALATSSEPFDVQALVAKPAVEALVGPVLPALAGIDENGLDLVLSQPAQHGQSEELRPVVAANERRDAALTPQVRQDFDDTGRTDRPGHVDGQTLADELDDDRQALQLLAVRTGVEYEVVGLDMEGRPRWQRMRPGAGDPLSAPHRRQLKLRLAYNRSAWLDLTECPSRPTKIRMRR